MGGASLMQLSGSGRLRRLIEITKYLSSDERSGVLAFLDQGDEDGESVQAPGSGEILGILKNMKDEMQKDLKEMQEQEKSDHEAFNELKAAKVQEIDVSEKSVIEKEKRIG